MQDPASKIVITSIVTTLLILLLVGFLISLFFQYQRRQIIYIKNLAEIKLEYEKNLLTAQLEIQESTFLNISQEIHDNIGLSLTLAKLNLNGIRLEDKQTAADLVGSSQELITKAIYDLSDLSKSFNAEVILNQGFISSLEIEIERIKRNPQYKIEFSVTGEPFYLDSKSEILLFRIFQESINNIVKHASADKIFVHLSFNVCRLQMSISDNGKGFDVAKIIDTKGNRSGLRNIKKRAALLNATSSITSKQDQGTTVSICLPINENHDKS